MSKADDIDITPEMIKEGVNVLHIAGVIERVRADEALVTDVYRAMVRVRTGDIAAGRSLRPIDHSVALSGTKPMGMPVSIR
jgi:hypothetical protein